MAQEVAILGAGCFWGVEEIFRKIPGVIDTEVGYCGGNLKNPTYKDVTTGQTGHAESIKILFDNTKISFSEILHYFFRLHDPTTLNRQHNDIGTQYRSVIFYQNDEQKNIAEKKKIEMNQSGRWKDPVVTEIAPVQEFYAAESEHQDYLQKYPQGYNCHFLRD